MVKFIWFIRALFLKLFYGHIGKKCYLGPALFVKKRKRIFIGDNVRIFPNMRAEVHGTGEICFLGDNSIGQNLHIVSASSLIIGLGTTISSNVFISNVDHEFQKGKSALKGNLLVKETKIGNYCFLGTGSVILPGTILGDNVVVGANSTVKGIYPDNCIIAGSPAKIIREVHN